MFGVPNALLLLSTLFYELLGKKVYLIDAHLQKEKSAFQSLLEHCVSDFVDLVLIYNQYGLEDVMMPQRAD